MMLKGGTPHGHGCFVRAPLSSFRGRLRVVRAASSSSSDSSSSSSYGDSDSRRDLQKDAALWDSAIKEARSLLDEASLLAEQQTRAELEEAFDKDRLRL